MSETNFSPEKHDPGVALTFDELAVGQEFYIPSRTMTGGLFAAFQSASGDNHPIHYDVEYCRRHGMKIYWHTASRF